MLQEAPKLFPMRFHTEQAYTSFAPHYLPSLSLEMRVLSDMYSYAHSAYWQDRVCMCNNSSQSYLHLKERIFVANHFFQLCFNSKE